MTAAAPVIVVGVDGSDGSREALHWAAGQPELMSAGVRVVAVWRWPNYLTMIPPGIDLAADTQRTVDEMTAEAAT